MFSKLTKVEPSTNWEMKVVIGQKIVNVPKSYTCSYQSIDLSRCLVEGLTIKNKYGSVFW